jgi:hypothetical protein
MYVHIQTLNPKPKAPAVKKKRRVFSKVARKKKRMTMTFSKGKSSNWGESHLRTPSAARIMKGSPFRNSEKSVAS